MPQFSEAISVKTINDISSYCLDCLIKSCLYVMSAVIVLYNLVQFMSQGWSVCHLSETTKQTGAGKSIFVPSFLEKRKPMTYDRYTVWVLLECKVCTAMKYCFPKTKS